MFKVSFNKDSKKVQTFNNRATVVTITGEMSFSSEVWDIFPDKITNWMWQHPSVDASWGTCTKEYDVIRLEFSGKSVCAEDDSFDAKIGERIAESRAMIDIYSFFYKLCCKLYDYYSSLLFGAEGIVAKGSGWSIEAAVRKYEKLWVCESKHLGELIKDNSNV